jgi:hypothetical protein
MRAAVDENPKYTFPDILGLMNHRLGLRSRQRGAHGPSHLDTDATPLQTAVHPANAPALAASHAPPDRLTKRRPVEISKRGTNGGTDPGAHAFAVEEADDVTDAATEVGCLVTTFMLMVYAFAVRRGG